MAKCPGNIHIIGTIGNLCFYKMQGEYYVRKKSSLTRKQVLNSPKFELTRVYASILGRASIIASIIYKGLPKSFREYWMFRAFTGEVFRLLKKGTADETALEKLWNTYVKLWHRKSNQGNKKRVPNMRINKSAA